MLCGCGPRRNPPEDLRGGGKLFIPQLGSTDKLQLAGDLAVGADPLPPCLCDVLKNVRRDRGRTWRIAKVLVTQGEVALQDRPLTRAVLTELLEKNVPEQDCQWLSHVASVWTHGMTNQLLT